MSFGVRELRDSDKEQVEAFLGRSDPYATLLLRDAVLGFDDYPGWWFGGLREGRTLQSVMAIEDRRAIMASDDVPCLEAMATYLKRDQAYITTAERHRHTILGPTETIDPFWKIFRELDRQLVSDTTQTLMASTSAGECPTKRLAMSFARKQDLGLVAEFEAMRLLEERGRDPRRGAGGPHIQPCAEAIEAQRVVIGREGGKPVFIAELRDMGPGKVLLARAFIPAAFRTRKRLVGGALFKLKFAPPSREKEVLFFAQGAEMRAAAERAGYVAKMTYRKIVTLG